MGKVVLNCSTAYEKCEEVIFGIDQAIEEQLKLAELDVQAAEEQLSEVEADDPTEGNC
jgi:hypothetical protein